MSKFAEGFNEYCYYICRIGDKYNSRLDEIKTYTDSAVEIAKKISDFATGIGTPTWEASIDAWLNGTVLSRLSTDMYKFAEGFNEYCYHMLTIGNGYTDEEIASKTTVAINVATEIGRFLDDLEAIHIERKKSVIGRWLTGPTKTETFFDYLATFGEKMSGSVRSFSGISSGTFVTDAMGAKAVAEKFVEFFAYLASDEVKLDDSSKWLWLFGEDSTFTTMLSQFEKLGEKIALFADKIQNIDTNKMLAATTAMKNISEAMLATTNSDKDAPERLTRALSILLPWMEDFVAFGMLLDENIASGMTMNSSVVESAASALKTAILSALTITEDDISNWLTITPVIDMSNVDSSIQKSARKSLRVGGISRSAERTIGSADRSRNETSNVTSNVTNDATVNVTGNTFEIRREDDINMLANKIAALVSSQQRGFGAPVKLLR